jgi:mono/diheme cytochrome c family protein
MKLLSIEKMATITLIAVIGLTFMAFVLPQDQKIGGPWDIPAKYQKMENPYADDASLVKAGKMMYNKHCKSCHGSDGLGDGSKAAQLETYPGDFTSDEFKEQSDGILFYKSIIGRDEMPNFEKKIPDEEDQWAVVMYVKTME